MALKITLKPGEVVYLGTSKLIVNVTRLRTYTSKVMFP